jgi:hypothetical protein
MPAIMPQANERTIIFLVIFRIPKRIACGVEVRRELEQMPEALLESECRDGLRAEEESDSDTSGQAKDDWTIPWRMISPSSCERCAPSAIRMPISFRRRATE